MDTQKPMTADIRAHLESFSYFLTGANEGLHSDPTLPDLDTCIMTGAHETIVAHYESWVLRGSPESGADPVDEAMEDEGV